MPIEKEKMIFYLRIIVCLSLIAFWSFWFTNSSIENKTRKIFSNKRKISPKKASQNIQVKKVDVSLTVAQVKASKITTNKNKQPITLKENTNKNIAIENKKETPISNPSLITKVSKESLQKKNITNELPKLATLQTVTISEKEKSKKEPVSKTEPTSKTEIKVKDKTETKIEISKPKDMINLDLPNSASATRKALVTTTTQKKLAAEPIPLRKEVVVQKSKLKPVSVQIQESKENEGLQKMYLSESWLPKYNNNTEGGIQEQKQSPPSIDFDKIAEQIELSGIVKNPNGESTAIIKNKANNFIEVLKKGDSYKGLKLLEINKNEVVLGNKVLNKFYTKKINLEK